MAVVVEPIVTSEKLRALLAEQCEHSSLDYKRPLNLAKGNAEGIVELAKDVAAMQSEPLGGYLVIGADDHGQPVAGLTPELAAHFDDATLRQKLGKYLTEPEIRIGEHEVDGNLFVLIYIAPSSTGWCIFRAPGEYEENGKKKYVFRVGDVFVRHGTRSERWTDGDRERIIEQEMERRKEAWRSELTGELVKQVNLGLAVSSLKEMPVAAMSWDLDAESFKDLVIELLRRNDDIPLRQMLTRARCDAGELLGADQAELRRLLDRLSSFAGLAIHHDRVSWTKQVVATMERIYELGLDESGDARKAFDPAWLWLDVIARVYALGALAVREEAWSTVKLLADRRPEGQVSEHWGSWLRHATTMAFRANIFDSVEKSGLLARAHNIIRADSALHPDRPADHGAILSSLCQFDVYAGLTVIGERGTLSSGNYYPHFARYYSPRSTPAFEVMVSNGPVREILFDGDDELLANAIARMSHVAGKEAFMFDGWEGVNSPKVDTFISKHGTLTDQ